MTNSYLYPNGSSLNNSSSYCVNQPQNPYCGQFGAEEIVDVIFLILFTLIGTAGNLLIISSIINESRAFKHGNLFIINLALADLIVSEKFLNLSNFFKIKVVLYFS